MTNYDYVLIPSVTGILHKNRNKTIIFDSVSRTGYNNLYNNIPHELYVVSDEQICDGDIIIFNDIVGKYRHDVHNETHDIITSEGKTYPFINTDYFRKIVITTDSDVLGATGVDIKSASCSLINAIVANNGKIRLVMVPGNDELVVVHE